jgi:hypothetical protein
MSGARLGVATRASTYPLAWFHAKDFEYSAHRDYVHLLAVTTPVHVEHRLHWLPSRHDEVLESLAVHRPFPVAVRDVARAGGNPPTVFVDPVGPGHWGRGGYKPSSRIDAGVSITPEISWRGGARSAPCTPSQPTEVRIVTCMVAGEGIANIQSISTQLVLLPSGRPRAWGSYGQRLPREARQPRRRLCQAVPGWDPFRLSCFNLD